ncbi:energy transducer TonB, partial [Pseudoalteromonas rubra]
MRKTVTLSIFSFFLISCVSTTPPTSPKEQIQYIDLTSDDKKELVNEYWVVEKRQDPKYPVDAA